MYERDCDKEYPFGIGTTKIFTTVEPGIDSIWTTFPSLMLNYLELF